MSLFGTIMVSKAKRINMRVLFCLQAYWGQPRHVPPCLTCWTRDKMLIHILGSCLHLWQVFLSLSLEESPLMVRDLMQGSFRCQALETTK